MGKQKIGCRQKGRILEENGGSRDGGGRRGETWVEGGMKEERRQGENKERGWTHYQEVRLEEDEGRNRRVWEGKKEEGKERGNEGEKK